MSVTEMGKESIVMEDTARAGTEARTNRVLTQYCLSVDYEGAGVGVAGGTEEGRRGWVRKGFACNCEEAEMYPAYMMGTCI